MGDTRYTVGQVAALSGVTVRALHHYGRIGLLVPAGRTGAGYRAYTDADLDRLTRILYYRELGFSLDAIAGLLDAAGDPAQHLRRQHELLTARLVRVQTMVTAIEKELEAAMSGTELSAEEKMEIFGDSYDPAYEDEAQQRWGHTGTWRQSRERTRRFGRDDWQKVKADTDALHARMVDVFRSGAAPGSAEADAIAEEHRAGINVFYECGHDMHRDLADMYLDDERFTKTYEDLAPGLTGWLRDAIHANADHAGG